MGCLTVHLQYLQTVLSSVESHREKVSLLLDFNRSFNSIANFGCNIGSETLALAWKLGANEAVGVDNNPDAIDQARSTLRNFFEEVDILQRNLPYYSNDTSAETRSTLVSIATQYSNQIRPQFVVADVTTTTNLPTDRFDLVFCERFLYHLACGKDESASHDTLAAIKEMKRVLKSGGLIVAIEPETCSLENPKPVKLDIHFERVGLSKYKNSENIFSLEGKNIYIYQKL